MLPLAERRRYLKALQAVVRDTGEAVLNYHAGPLTDTFDFHGHESSSIDTDVRQWVQAAIERELPGFKGTLRFELWPYDRKPIEQHTGNRRLSLVVDELDGTTNTKRCLSSVLHYRPLAIISIALSASDSLKDMVASAIFCLENSDIFSAIRVDDNAYLSFCNGRLLDPEDFRVRRGDSRERILVIGYSNSHRLQKGELEQALYDQRMKVYEGCRSSGLDVIGLIRNANDAYVDLRAFWSRKDEGGRETEAMLQVYDIAGAIPIALGCGLIVTDAKGGSWEQYGLLDAMSLVVGRPDIHGRILETIKPLVEVWTA